MRQRLHRVSRAAYSHPLWVVVLGAVLTVGVLAALGGSAWSLYHSQRGGQETAVRMQFLLSRVAVLDEVTTRSARMAAVRGTPAWREQYRDVAPMLSAALDELVEAADAMGQRPVAIRIRDAERRMKRVEREVLERATRGERTAAVNLLSTDEYNAQKQVLTGGIRHLSSSVQEHLQAYNRSVQRRGLVGGLLVAAGLIVLLLIWWFALSLLRRYLSERRQAEAELAAERDFATAVIDGSPNGVLVKDADGRIVLVNDFLANFYGLPPEEIVGKSPEELGLAVEYAERFRRADHEVLETGEEVTLAATPVTPPRGGGARWIETRKVPLRAPDGRPQVLSILRDVTEQKEAEDALRESEARLQALIHASPLPIEALDPEGNVTLWNPAAERILGWMREEVLGRPHPLVPGEKQEEFRALKDRVLRGESFSGVEVRRKKKDGTAIDLRLSTAPLRDARGAVMGAMAVMEDVTEETRARAALRESERRLSTLVRSLPGVVYRSLNDPEWTMEYIGGRTEELVGYAPEELLGEGAVSFAEMQHPEERAQIWEAVQRALERKEPFQLEYRIRTAGGEDKCVWEQGEGVFSAAGELEALEGFITDVTAIKRAEERERQLLLETSAREHAEAAQERIEGILESITDAFYAVDDRWRFTYVNPQVERLSGMRREDLLGRSIWDALNVDAESPSRSRFRKVVEEQVPVEFEEYSPGRGLWLRVRAYPHEEGLVAYVRDITGLRQAEEAQRASESRFRSLTEYSSDLVTLLDSQGVIRYASASATRVLGYEREELLGKSALELTHPEDVPVTLATLRRFVTEPAAVHRVELRVRHRDGSWRLLEARGSNRLQDPAVQGLVVNFRDVTIQRNAEEALRRREAQLSEAQRLAELGSWEWDLRDDQVTWSDNLYRIFGLRPDEFSATFEGYLERLHPEDRERVRATIEEAVDTGEFRFECRFVRGDGELRYQSARGQLLRDHQMNPAGMVGTCQDTTERKQVEEALRRAKEEAERASRAQSELLSRTSHELRTPMNAILGFAQLLEMELEEDEEHRESVEQILRAGGHLLRLIDGVLNIADAESGQMTIPAAPVQVGELADEALSLLRPLARENRVELPLSSLPACDVHVLGDPQRLRQVLLNLLSNAIKFNREGGRVEVFCREIEHERVRIEVRDSGPGIPPEKLSRLFAPFERAGAERSEVEGAGLGLALSKALTHAMGGEIGAESPRGEGSTFWVELSQAHPGSRVGEDAPEAEPAAAASMQAPLVLYVEDTPENVRLVERIFRRSRPEVELITAPDGREGLELARERRPDLILLDLNLPEISGEEVLLALRGEESTRRIPVVMISGDANPEQIGRLLEQGAAHYLTKPFQVPHFLQVVHDVLTGDAVK